MKIRKVFYIMLVLFFIFIFTAFRGSIKGFLIRSLYTPLEIKQDSFIDLDLVEFPNKEKLQFYSIYRGGKGYCALKKSIISIDGTVYRVYIITNNGKLTLVKDYTSDSHGNRKFVIEEPNDVVLGYYNSVGEFQLFKPDNEYPDLQLKVR